MWGALKDPDFALLTGEQLPGCQRTYNFAAVATGPLLVGQEFKAQVSTITALPTALWHSPPGQP